MSSVDLTEKKKGNLSVSEAATFLYEIAPSSSVLGIAEGDYQELAERKPISGDLKESLKVNSIIEEINYVITDEEFKSKLISKIMLVKNYGTVKAGATWLKGTFKSFDGNREYTFSMTIGNCITEFTFYDNEGKTMYAEYISIGSLDDFKPKLIKYKTFDVKKEPIDNHTDLYDALSSRVVHRFDDYGYEVSLTESLKHRNYYLDKLTKKETLCCLDPAKNCEDRTHKYRSPGSECDDIIFMETERKYFNCTDFDKQYGYNSILAYHHDGPIGMRIPTAGDYIWIDPKLWNRYKNGQCSKGKVFGPEARVYQLFRR